MHPTTNLQEARTRMLEGAYDAALAAIANYCQLLDGDDSLTSDAVEQVIRELNELLLLARSSRSHVIVDWSNLWFSRKYCPSTELAHAVDMRA